MLWMMLWALVLGFATSAAIQVYVSDQRMGKMLGHAGLREVGLATLLGAASSSCSYAAVATARTLFQKGASAAAATAFMIASTNLVLELGAVIWITLGWRFVVAEVAGAAVMITLIWIIYRVTVRPAAEKAVREHAQHISAHEHEHGGHEHHHHDHHGDDAEDEHGNAHSPAHHGGHGMEGDAGSPRSRRIADAFWMEWSMLWREILVGVLLAGILMSAVPADWWRHIFLVGSPAPIRLLENVLIGPLVASATFVCSVGNIPMAAMLWSSGCGFGGVIAFIYGDLIIPPLVVAYRRYYGTRPTIYLAVVLFVAMAVAGAVVDLVFAATGLKPADHAGAMSHLAHGSFGWNYTTWLNLVALIVAAALATIHLRGAQRTE